MALFIIRNAIPICFLSTGIAAELGIQPLGGKGSAAGLTGAVFSLLRSPPFQFLLIPMIATQRIQTIPLGFNGGVEYSAAALTMKPTDMEMSILAQHPFLVVFL